MAARRFDPPAWWARVASRGIQVTWWGLDSYPVALREDPQPPGVLFWRGSLHALDRPCVAIVGTRQASPDGRAVAFELGRDLAAAGICVVSGLALGIDGAAHSGALAGWTRDWEPEAVSGRSIAPCRSGIAAVEASCRDRHAPPVPVGPGAPVGVAASGVDVPYPRRHTALWDAVAEAGAVLSEALPGRPAEGWRFPARNRIIAGLVRMVVVVESHTRGGSLITADAAIARGVDVRVVPGPVHSPASAGSNQLLYDGPGPVRDARDVLDGLGIFVPDRGRPRAGRSRHDGPARPERDAGRAGASRSPAPDPAGDSSPTSTSAAWPADAGRVIEAAGWRPASLNQIVRRTGLPVPTTMALLDRLEAGGVLSRQGDWWVRNR
jgi:DNA processing protein